MRRSYLIAAAIAVLAAGWLASGMLTGPGDGGRSDATPSPSGAAAAPLADEAPEVDPQDDSQGDPGASDEIVEPAGAPASPTPAQPGGILSVQVMDSLAAAQPRTIVLRGRTEADHVVEVRAETYGRVVETPAEKGSVVQEGDLLVTIDSSDRAARLAEAKALLQQRKAESDAARQLAEKGFAPKLNLPELAANLALAQAQATAIEIEIAHLTIESPIEGVLDDRAIDVGSYLQVADPVATIVDLDPIVLVGFATEGDVGDLEIGGEAQARLLDGGAVAGKVRFISSRAEEETRTFRIEVEVPNADYAIRDGLSAEVVIPVDAVPAHRVSPAILTLGPNGAVGVKLVDEANKVRFTPVEILREDADGLWISGLPEKARMIVVGQDFVLDGQLVRPVEASAAPATTAQ